MTAKVYACSVVDGVRGFSRKREEAVVKFDPGSTCRTLVRLAHGALQQTYRYTLGSARC